MKLTLFSTLIAVSLFGVMANPALAAAEDSLPDTGEKVSLAITVPSTTPIKAGVQQTDVDRYADREGEKKELQSFRGGEGIGIYIGGGALTVALLVVLLVVLL